MKRKGTRGGSTPRLGRIERLGASSRGEGTWSFVSLYGLERRKTNVMGDPPLLPRILLLQLRLGVFEMSQKLLTIREF